MNQIHSAHTRFKTNLHPPIANLTKFQQGVYYSRIKMFNNLPLDITDLANQITLLRNALKRGLLTNSFHNSEDIISNKALWKVAGQEDINLEIRKRKFRWIGHTLTLRRLMSYIYMEHPFLMFLDHTQRRSTVGKTPLDE